MTTITASHGLSSGAFRSLVDELPSPLFVRVYGDAEFSVYRAKDFHASTWEHDGLRELVGEARRSYLRYGAVPFWDQYDDKAAVYLARVRYPGPRVSDRIVEEWLSLRFVPGDGVPHGTLDFDDCVCDGRPLATLVQERLYCADPNFMRRVVSLSRICKITPYFFSERGVRVSVPYSDRLRHTAVSFALINDCFSHDALRRELSYTHLTGLLRDDLMDSILTLQTARGDRVPTFSPAYELLGDDVEGRIRIDRTVEAYRFPFYFLNSDELFTALEDLVCAGTLTEKTMRQYLRVSSRFADVVRDCTTPAFREMVRHLGLLTSARGRISGSNLTGAVLRARLDREVRDGPGLKIMTLADWRRSVTSCLDEYAAHYAFEHTAV